MEQAPYQRFHANLVSFLDLIIDIWPEEHQEILKDELIESKDDLSKEIDSRKEEIIYQFIEKTHPYWLDLVPARDEQFLSECLEAILIIPSKQVKASSNLILSDQLEYEELKIVWDFIDSFVSISLVEIHEKRNPVHRLNWETHRYEPTYTRNYWNNIDIIKHSKKYPQVKLEWKP